MFKYVKYNQESGLCTAVGTGTNTEFYKSIGMVRKDVEQSEVDGCWYLTAKCPHYTDEEKLVNAKTAKVKELVALTDKFEENKNNDMFFTSSLGFRVNGDRRTRSNIEDLIQFSAEFPVDYRDYDNKIEKVSKEDLEVMLAEHIENGHNLYAQKWEYEQKIAAAKTVEEVEAIEFNFEMMDFTKE